MAGWWPFSREGRKGGEGEAVCQQHGWKQLSMPEEASGSFPEKLQPYQKRPASEMNENKEKPMKTMK